MRVQQKIIHLNGRLEVAVRLASEIQRAIDEGFYVKFLEIQGDSWALAILEKIIEPDQLAKDQIW